MQPSELILRLITLLNVSEPGSALRNSLITLAELTPDHEFVVCSMKHTPSEGGTWISGAVDASSTGIIYLIEDLFAYLPAEEQTKLRQSLKTLQYRQLYTPATPTSNSIH